MNLKNKLRLSSKFGSEGLRIGLLSSEDNKTDSPSPPGLVLTYKIFTQVLGTRLDQYPRRLHLQPFSLSFFGYNKATSKQPEIFLTVETERDMEKMALNARFSRKWHSPNVRKTFHSVGRARAVVTGFGLAAWGIGKFKTEFPAQAGNIQEEVKKKAKNTFSSLHSKALSIRAMDRDDGLAEGW